MSHILRLYPLPAQEIPLEGAYLSDQLRQRALDSQAVFIYSNFVTSLDGRIAIPHPTRPGLMVPKSTANERDWRLFQELAVQADLIISSGRYLRDWADGRAQEILHVDDPQFADLKRWRREQGLSPQPDLAIISNSLDFPIPEVLRAGGRTVVVFTSGKPDPQRVKEIEYAAGKVLVLEGESVDGAVMARCMGEMGYKIVYSAAGPKVLHLLLSGGVLNRLYLTYANRLLGGKVFSTIVDGELFTPPIDMRLDSIYFDPFGLDGSGQLFASYERVSSK